MSRFTSWILAAALFAAPLAGQSRSASTTATTTVIANLSLTATQAMILGNPSGNFATAGVVTSSDAGAQAARWVGTTDPGNDIQVQFTTLPTQLATSGGAHVPFSCGAQSGVISGGSAGGFFNPNTAAGISGPINSAGQFNVSLGENGSPGPNTNNCSSDLTGARAGVYSATVTLTATVR